MREITQEKYRELLGFVIRKLRKEKHTSVDFVANYAKKSVAHIYNIERGKIFPSFPTYMKISEALGVSYDWIICEIYEIIFKMPAN